MTRGRARATGTAVMVAAKKARWSADPLPSFPPRGDRLKTMSITLRSESFGARWRTAAVGAAAAGVAETVVVTEETVAAIWATITASLIDRQASRSQT